MQRLRRRTRAVARLIVLLLCIVINSSVSEAGSLSLKDSTLYTTATQQLLGRPDRRVLSITAGDEFTCVLLAEGTIKCWGSNRFGQLGDGTNTDSTKPVVAQNSIAYNRRVANRLIAGGVHVCALVFGETINCWGRNNENQFINQYRTIYQVVAGDGHTCILVERGQVACAGRNSQGQLGIGVFTDQSPATKVLALEGEVIALAAGGNHTCAIIVGGAVKCWGENQHGQLGIGTTSFANVATPATVAGLENGVVAVEAGDGHTCALLLGGMVKCWGNNNQGQLGNGLTTDRINAPVSVLSLLNGARALALGDHHSCALLDSGEVQCWGQHGFSSRNRLVPTLIDGLGGSVTALTAGKLHTCVLLDNQVVKCWGNNDAGQLGNTTTRASTVPTLVYGLAPFDSASIHLSHQCALDVGRGILCWGANDFGEVSADTTQPLKPVKIQNYQSFQRVVTGDGFSCALDTVGKVSCWGRNDYGQLGQLPDALQPLAEKVTALVAGRTHVCALGEGRIYCWGAVSVEPSDDASTYPLIEKKLTGISGTVKQITAGLYHTCALDSSGGIWCWGSNTFGQMGVSVSQTPQQSAAQRIPRLTEPVSNISSGDYHTCALLVTGGVVCWGANFVGQLGRGSVAESATADYVAGLTSNVLTITTGPYYACALLSDGRQRCWGLQAHDQHSTGRIYAAPVDMVTWMFPNLLQTLNNRVFLPVIEFP